MKTSTLRGGVVAAIGIIALTAGPQALAQKSKDTFRSAFRSPIRGLSYYYDPKPDTVFEQSAVFDGLVAYDEKAGKFEPLLAKSWKRIDAKTIEFELRDDVKWHDGEKFDADDVVYTYRWLIDPKTRIRFKRFWGWIESVEKLGPYRVRITAKRPTPFDLTRHAYLTAILPEHIHGKLKNKVDFGRHPVGTGMYKAIQVDANKGIILERNDQYRHGGKGKPASNIKRMVFRAIPDTGTQIAEFLAGNLDMIRDMNLEQGENLAKQPGVELTVGQGISYLYMAIDAKGRSGVKALTDSRVRKALMMAVDRDAILKYRVGNRKVAVPKAMCWKIQAGCDFDVPLPEYDPAGARKLLAEAGYPNGLNLEITTFDNPTIRGAAELVSGMLARIGVRAKVDARVIGAYRKKQASGKIQVIAAAWPAGGFPDVSGTLGFIFSTPPSRDYHGDDTLRKMARRMNGIMDPVKRRALGKMVFNRATEMAYFIPLGPNPVNVVHRDTVSVDATAMGAFTIDPSGLRWK